MKFSQDNWTGVDKVKHIVVGVIMSLVICTGLHYFKITFIESILVALSFVFIIATGKELHDQSTSGFSYKDLLATMLGGVLGTVPFLLVVLKG